MAMPPIFFAIAIGALSFHVLVCLYAMAYPDAVASEIAKPSRSFLAWIYLGALSVFRTIPKWISCRQACRMARSSRIAGAERS